MTDFSEMCQDAYMIAQSKGWHDEERSFGDIIALIHSEASEALEAYRERDFDAWRGPDGKPCGVASELADIVIRVMDAACMYKIDLEGEVLLKMDYNRTRGYRHGGKAL